MHWHSAAFGLKVFSGTTSRYTDTEALLVTNLEKGIPLKGISLKRVSFLTKDIEKGALLKG